LSTGQNVYEVLGPGFTLLTFGKQPKEVQMWVDAAAALNIPLTLVTEAAGAQADRYEATWIMVRPDQFIAWTSQDAHLDATQAQQLLRDIVGAP
jgi:hypothetical protein